MSDEPLYLIAHKVRGEPAFDIAQHLECPTCNGTNDHCHQCDGVGHWWIIPTSGHRAFPIMNWQLDQCVGNYQPDCDWQPTIDEEAGPIKEHPEWATLRDHYTTEREAAFNLVNALGLAAKPSVPLPPIKRRF